MSKIWKSILSGIAIGCGFTVWIVWLIMRHRKNVEDALEILQIDKPLSYKLASEAAKEQEDLRYRAKEVIKRLEKETKQEVIDAFKEAFNVKPAANTD